MKGEKIKTIYLCCGILILFLLRKNFQLDILEIIEVLLFVIGALVKICEVLKNDA
ncbi:hypothetical protein [Fusobacterium ulcerans]|uniref:hypothetical protein n=1 Tax=Fusobacterium ulcerans TaxID=861 RepID=UPI0027BB143D|nr:hypothetical protein [Fusobacterium ulcerans]